MRIEREMMETIHSFIEKHPDIQCAYLNGSRANPNAPIDIYQDYDLVCVVDSLSPYINTSSWLNQLGAVSFIQEPNWQVKGDLSIQWYGWLILFEDHNRIDLTLETRDHFMSKTKDSMTKVLYDPHHYFDQNIVSSDRDYWISKPSQAIFHESVNNFWWCLNNVGKGIMRDEMPYALKMFHQECIGALDQVIEWDLAFQHTFKLNPGKLGKWFKDFMEPHDYERYLKTYTSAKKDALWEGIDCAMDLMSLYAKRVAKALDYPYIESEEHAIRSYLSWIKLTKHQHQ